MGSLSNLYISQSYQSLIHLGTNNTASANLIELQDGLGNSIGVAVNTNGDLFLSGSLTASLQQGYLYVGGANGKTTAFATSSLVTNINTGSLVTTSSFNSYTQSTNIRLNNLETTSASVNISISNLNSTTASQAISITNLNSATSSYVTESETASFARTNVDNNFSANQTFTNIIAVSASFTYVQTLYETSSVIYSSGSNQFGDELSDIQTLSGSVKVQGSLTVNGTPVLTSSVDISGLTTTASFNAYTQSNDQKVNSLINATASYVTESETSSFVTNIANNPLTPLTFTYDQPGTFTNVTIDLPANVVSSSAQITALGFVSSSVTASSLVTASFDNGTRNLTFTKGDASTFNVNIPDVSGSTGNFATTGSNVFTGIQTLSDAALNAVSLVEVSSSLMLVAKGFTSASAHLSSSINSGSNLIFKYNNQTQDTIISGSGNIFPNFNPAAAGFKRYVGGSGNIFTSEGGVALSGSIAFPVNMNRNIGDNTFTIRGPISSSAWTLDQNLTLGGATSIGSSAANNAEKIVGGLTFSQNALWGGTFQIIANKTPISSSAIVTSNLIFGASVVANLNSSSMNYSSNIQNGGITINNNFTAVGGATGNNARIGVLINTIYGVNHRLNTAGTNTSATGIRSMYAGFLAGSNISCSIEGTGDKTSLVAVGLLGNALIISGSSTNPNQTPLSNADGTHGSFIAGRYNAVDGTRALSAETVFAVGTGTGHNTRKTGFLIDSGSNTFVEGTFNVSGSTTLSGSLYIQSGSTLPSATGSSILTWNPTTGQVSQSPIATLISSSFSVGAFNSTITQSGSAAVSQSMTFNNTDISNGVSIVSNSQITLANTGTYNIQFSAQLLAGTGADTIWIWLKKNGTNVSNTATKLVLRNNEADVAAWNFVVPATASDYFELVWQSLDGHATLLTEAAAGNYPAIPSIILTVTQVE